ncbi:hypothetical protein CMUS01_11316 [Colletotrichum musicola]|uniref:Uncharacterized protein n=1 Tax=Colletotrichum musicola TaxID=2175873 RepID=A0A8H6N718_9PEZI|nr:hypothetical protein CMUS01_11316 [Colletotrichum musicola]
MRSLCQGRAPPTVLDVIQFLCVAKAMEETLGKMLCEGYLETFLSDLHRWQALFASSERTADLETYKDAVRSLWGVELEERADISADINVLGKFQSLASSLAARAGILLDDAFHNGSEPVENKTEGGGGHDYRETAWGTPSRNEDFQPAPPEPKPPDPLDRVLQKLSKLTESLRTEFPPISTMSQRLLIFESEVVKGWSLVRFEGFCGDQLCWV